MLPVVLAKPAPRDRQARLREVAGLPVQSQGDDVVAKVGIVGARRVGSAGAKNARRVWTASPIRSRSPTGAASCTAATAASRTTVAARGSRTSRIMSSAGRPNSARKRAALLPSWLGTTIAARHSAPATAKRICLARRSGSSESRASSDADGGHRGPLEQLGRLSQIRDAAAKGEQNREPDHGEGQKRGGKERARGAARPAGQRSPPPRTPLRPPRRPGW